MIDRTLETGHADNGLPDNIDAADIFFEKHSKGLTGVGKPEAMGDSIVYLPVKPGSDWNENLLQLKPLFGKILLEAYATSGEVPTDAAIKEQLTFSFKDASGVYVHTDGDSISAYFAVEKVTPEHTDATMAAMGDVNVATEAQNRGIGTLLLRTAFQREQKDYVIGETTNIAAIVAIGRAAEESGYDAALFAPNDADYPEDIRIKIETARAENMIGIARKGFLPNTDRPADDEYVRPLPPGNEGFFLVKSAYLPTVNPKLVDPEAQEYIGDQHPLYSRVQKLVDLQKPYGFTPDNTATVLGHYFCFKTQESAEEDRKESFLVRAR